MEDEGEWGRGCLSEARGRPANPHLTGAGGRVLGLGPEMGAQGLLSVPPAWAGLTHVPSAACGRGAWACHSVCWACRAVALHVPDACWLNERGAGTRLPEHGPPGGARAALAQKSGPQESPALPSLPAKRLPDSTFFFSITSE